MVYLKGNTQNRSVYKYTYIDIRTHKSQKIHYICIINISGSVDKYSIHRI